MVEILITFPLEDEFVNKLRGISPQLHITVSPARKAEDITNDIWGKIDILFTDGAVVPIPEKTQNLKWIQFMSTGLDYWVDKAIFSKPELMITSLSGAGSSQMAEHVVMMMLTLGHKLPAMMAHQRKSEWPKDRIEKLLPVELRGATVGIVGYGSIGRQVARLLEPFGTTVLATKRDAKSPEDHEFTQEGLGDPTGSLVHRLYPAEALRSMLKISDFIVVCVPLTPKTRGLLGASALAATKTGAYLVDVSRGKILDHGSLIKALQDGKLAGAALDVFPEEPLPVESPLWGMSNVIITPHVADNSPHFEQQACLLFSENLHRFLAEIPLYNLYSLERGY
jgi:phosphoglycerate dehydrogenase-like enzyme